MLKFKSFLVFLIFLLLILAISCTNSKSKDISTFTVSYKNFENSLTVDGFVEAVRTTTINCPMGGAIGSSGMIVIINGSVTGNDQKIVKLVEDGSFVHAGDTVCIIEKPTLLTAYENALIELENTIADFNKTKANLNLQYTLLEAQVESNNVSTKIAQLDSLQLIYSPPNIRKMKELELEKIAIQKEQLEKKLKSLSIINQTEIKKWEFQIQRINNRINDYKKQMDELFLVAPKDGFVMVAKDLLNGNKYREGDNVWMNMPVVTIPENSEMKVKIRASETDYKYISLNDSVNFTFDAMPGNKAWGKIIKKSPVGSPYKRGSKLKYFDIEASIDSALTLPSPDFTANCHIILKEIKDTLVIPIISVFEEDSIKIVYVKNKKGFEMRQILTGLSSSKEVIITSGLEENEKVALTKPSSSFVNNKVLIIKEEEEEEEENNLNNN